ncbi:MAG: GAF domain-containing protein [Kaiparowitsia implicata GSE-PSE-MK54-09C]|nr:GAF domain-containing protein [Kaiparowitsia implicata GSE-PSE-MK54-09C]
MPLEPIPPNSAPSQRPSPTATVSPDCSLAAAIKLLHPQPSRCVLVMTQGTLCGIVTGQDVVGAIARGLDTSAPVSAVMSHPVITLSELDAGNLLKAAQLLHHHRIHHLPIVSEGGEVVRILTLDAIQQQLMAPVPAVGGGPESEAASLLNSSVVAIAQFSSDAEGHLLYQIGSAGVAQLFGHASQAFQTTPTLWQSRIHPDDAPRVQHSCRAALLTVDPITVEYRFLTQHQEMRWIATQLRRQPHPQSEPFHLTTLSIDITPIKRTHELLARSQDGYRQTIEHSPIPIFSIQRDGTIQSWNAACRDLYGYSATICGESMASIVHRLDYPLSISQMTERVFAGQSLSNVELIYRCHDGAFRHSLTRFYPLKDPMGKVITCVVANTDITERIQIERLRAQQARRDRLIHWMTQQVRRSLDLDVVLQTTVTEVRQFLQVDRVVIYRFNPDWSGSFVVESIVASRYSLVGEIYHDPCFGDQQAQPYRDGRTSAIDNVGTANIEPCYRDLLDHFQVMANLVVPIRSGDRLWGLLIAHHCTRPRVWQPWEKDLLLQLAEQAGIAIQQSTLYSQLQTLNITLEQTVERRTQQLRRALHHEELLKRITDRVCDSLDESQILQTAVQEIATGLEVSICDTGIYDLEAQTSNIRYEHVVTAVPSVQHRLVMMKNYPEIYPSLLAGESLHFCWRLHREGDCVTIRALTQPFSVFACPLIDDQGVIGDLWLYKLNGACFDELEIRLVQQVANQCAIAIRQARLYEAAHAQVKELERLNHLKDDFLCSVSHELRTPMANIHMAAQMLEMSFAKLGLLDDQPMHRYLTILTEACQQELDLINTLLDLSRLDAETEPLLLADIEPHTWIRHVVEPFLQQAQRQQQTLTIALPPHLPTVHTDSSYLGRILSELLTNACKYTPAAEQIRITAKPLADFLTISVSNSGVEIAPEEQTHVFERFYRIPNHDPWKHGGTGLGLALSKKLAEHLGGVLSVSSCDAWTTFDLCLPLRPPAHHTKRAVLPIAH